MGCCHLNAPPLSNLPINPKEKGAPEANRERTFESELEMNVPCNGVECTSPFDGMSQPMLPIAPSNEEFLKGVFGEEWPRAHVTGFVEDPYDLDSLNLRHYWGGGPAEKRLVRCLPGYNNYFTISLFRLGDDYSPHRRKDLHDATYVITIDDVHDKVPVENLKALPSPSYILETSPGNEQWGYILTTPETNPARVDALLNGLVAAGIAQDNKDPGMKGVTRYVRLPVGSNTKKKYGNPFGCRMKKWEPQHTHALEDLGRPFNIDLTNITPGLGARAYIPLDETVDPVLPLLSQAGLLKGILKPGAYEMECPWLADHTGGADSGAAYLSPFGFKCHHGHCDTKNFSDLLAYLDMEIPGARAALEWAKRVSQFDNGNLWPFEIAETWKTEIGIKDHGSWLLHLRVLDPARYDALLRKWEFFGVAGRAAVDGFEAQALMEATKADDVLAAREKARQGAQEAVIREFGTDDQQDQAALTAACEATTAHYEQRRTQWASDLKMRVQVLDSLRDLYQRKLETELAAAGEKDGVDDGKPGKPLNIRIPAPATSLQDGRVLFEDLRKHIAKYVVATLEQLTALTVYVLFTHAHQQGLLGLAPKLGLLAPVKEAGKSTAAKTVAALGGASYGILDVTGPLLFRVFECSPVPFTLLLDEFDAKAKDMPEQVRAVLNGGYDIETAAVARCTGDDHEPREFGCYGPQIYCAIGAVPDTVASRSIIIQMRRAGLSDKFERRYTLDDTRLGLEAHLAGRAARWTADNISEVKKRLRTVKVPDLGSPRREDNWRPMFAIMEVMFGTVPADIEAAARSLSTTGTDRADAVSMLMDDLAALVVGVFGVKWNAVTTSTPRAGLPTVLILEYLNSLDARPWSTWARGTPIDAKRLARILQPLAVSPTDLGPSKARWKGYPIDTLASAFNSYVADMPTALTADQKQEVKTAVKALQSPHDPSFPTWPVSWSVTPEAKP